MLTYSAGHFRHVTIQVGGSRWFGSFEAFYLTWVCNPADEKRRYTITSRAGPFHMTAESFRCS